MSETQLRHICLGNALIRVHAALAKDVPARSAPSRVQRARASVDRESTDVPFPKASPFEDAGEACDVAFSGTPANQLAVDELFNTGSEHDHGDDSCVGTPNFACAQF